MYKWIAPKSHILLLWPLRNVYPPPPPRPHFPLKLWTAESLQSSHHEVNPPTPPHFLGTVATGASMSHINTIVLVGRIAK